MSLNESNVENQVKKLEIARKAAILRRFRDEAIDNEKDKGKISETYTRLIELQLMEKEISKQKKLYEHYRNVIAHKYSNENITNSTNIESEYVMVKIASEGLETVKELQKITNSDNFTDVVQNALIVYKTLIDYSKKGYKIQLDNGKSKPKEIRLIENE